MALRLKELRISIMMKQKRVMKNSRILVLILVCTSLTLFSQKRKVILIGIDGLQFEQIAQTNTPNFDKFIIKKGFTGGVLGSKTQQVTSSGPSWMTILTGVWVNKHKVISNSSQQISHSKSIFNYIKTANPKSYTSSISTWKNINLLLYKDMYKVDFSSQGEGDDHSTSLAVSQINDKAPDFIFIHLDDIDHAGHAYGFGDEYAESINKMDKRIGRVLAAVDKREYMNNEEWLVILVTDHGRGPKGKGHGNQTISEKTIFIGLNKKGNSFFEGINNDSDVLSIQDLERNTLPQTAIVPTILKFLKISIKKEWGLDASPLVD